MSTAAALPVTPRWKKRSIERLRSLRARYIVLMEISKETRAISSDRRTGSDIRMNTEVVRNFARAGRSVDLIRLRMPQSLHYSTRQIVMCAHLPMSDSRVAVRTSNSGLRTSPGFFSRSDRSVFFPDGRLYQYACRRAVRMSALRFGTRRSAEAATLQLLQSKGARTGHCFAITMSDRRSGARHDKVIRVPPAETLVQANALGAMVGRPIVGATCEGSQGLRATWRQCSGCLCGLAGRAVCCPRSRPTYTPP